MFLLADRINTNVLIRASHNRKINKTAINSDISGTIQVRVPRKDRKPERLATCNIKFSNVNVFPSRNYKGSNFL